jgi:hypothetical protein
MSILQTTQTNRVTSRFDHSTEPIGTRAHQNVARDLEFERPRMLDLDRRYQETQVRKEDREGSIRLPSSGGDDSREEKSEAKVKIELACSIEVDSRERKLEKSWGSGYMCRRRLRSPLCELEMQEYRERATSLVRKGIGQYGGVNDDFDLLED